MFERALLAGPQDSHRGATFALSMGAQVLSLGAAILLPLFLIEGPGFIKMNALRIGPPPPAPRRSIKLVETPAKFGLRIPFAKSVFAYRRIPEKVAAIVEMDLPPEPGLSNRGTAGDLRSMDGVPGGLFTETLAQLPKPVVLAEPVKAKPPAAEQPAQRLNVSSGVQAAKLVKKVIPPYPQLARAARIQGSVRLVGIISKDGRIIQLQVLSGHPLLVTAAVDAVKQWIYQPTLLSGTPVEVIAPIDVHFTLGN